jgi:hypothetical protein
MPLAASAAAHARDRKDAKHAMLSPIVATGGAA